MANRIFTPKHLDYLRKIAPGKSTPEMLELFNQQFGTRLTLNQLKVCRKNHHISSGLDGRFQPGHVPANKGKQMPSRGRSKEAQFKPGNRPQTWKPVGSETLRSDGYVWVKIAEPNRWRQKHVLIWEAANGPRPKGHKIIFANRNNQDFRLENLLLVSSGELTRMNQNRLISTDGDITRTGVAVAKLLNAMGAAKRRNRKRGAKA